MKTATEIKRLETHKGDARLYRLSEPHKDYPSWDSNGEEEGKAHDFVIVSAVVALQIEGPGPETYIFPADENGEIVSWGEMPGSLKGTLSHAEALENAGYTITEEE